MKNVAALTIRLLLLAVVGYAVMQTLLLLLSASGKDMYGMVDPMVKWVPRVFQWRNYNRAFEVLGGLRDSLGCLAMYLGVAAGQVLSSALIAYGFSRYGFKGRGILLALMAATFFIPQQVTFLPRYVLFSRYGMLGTAWTLYLPSLLGQGIKNALLILIFRQFLRGIPVSLDEAAMMDGAGLVRTMLNIDMPLATPGFVICSVLSFAWNWNDTYFADVYLKGQIPTMTLNLSRVRELYDASMSGAGGMALDSYFHAGIEAAAAVLVILPPLILYLLMEKRLIESVDRAGITGE